MEWSEFVHSEVVKSLQRDSVMETMQELSRYMVIYQREYHKVQAKPATVQSKPFLSLVS